MLWCLLADAASSYYLALLSLLSPHSSLHSSLSPFLLNHMFYLHFMQYIYIYIYRHHEINKQTNNKETNTKTSIHLCVYSGRNNNTLWRDWSLAMWSAFFLDSSICLHSNWLAFIPVIRKGKKEGHFIKTVH